MLRRVHRSVLPGLVLLLATLLGVMTAPAASAHPHPDLPVDGPAVDVELTSTDHPAELLFTAAEAGKPLVISTPAVEATGGVTLTVIAPDGRQLFAQTVGAGWSTVIEDPAAGEHGVLVTPDVGVTGTATVQLATQRDEPPADPDALPLDGTVVSSALVAGTNRTLNFTATAGQRIRLGVTELTATGRVRLIVTAPDGSRPLDGVNAAAGPEWILESTLEGRYTLEIDPEGLVTATVGVKAEIVTDLPTAPLELDGPTYPARFPATGQNQTLELTAPAARRIRLLVPARESTGRIRISVTAPDGKVLITPTAVTAGTLWLLEPTQAGVYTVFLDPEAVTTGAVDVRAELVAPDAEHTIDVDGVDVTTATAAAGENVVLWFDGEAGQRYRIQTPDVTSTGRVRLVLTGPDGKEALSTTATTGGAWLLETVQTGRYRMYVDPEDVAIATVSWRIQSVQDLAEARLRIDGQATTSVFSQPGANRTLTFAGKVGQRLVLTATPATTTGRISLTVTDPAGTQLGSGRADVAGTWVIEPTRNGTHRVLLDPNGTTTGTVALSLRTVTDLPDAALEAGGPAVGSTFGPGENRTLTFTATAGQQRRITVPASDLEGDLRLTLTAPDGTRVLNAVRAPQGYAYLIRSTQAGTYRVLLDPVGSRTGTASVQLAIP